MADTHLDKLKRLVKERMEGEGTGHDWLHVQRVLNNCRLLAKECPCDEDLLMTCAVLHDVADHKFGYSSEQRGVLIAELMREAGYSDHMWWPVIEVVESISFSQGRECDPSVKSESRLLQDADRLDALGAVGIARTFAYGGAKGRPLYGENDDDSISHFYDKLLKLAAQMNTEAAKRLAAPRHDFLLEYLSHFYAECGEQPKEVVIK